MVESFAEYFDLKGAVGLFCVIRPEGSRFEELLSDLPVSRGTLDARLKEGDELGLLSKEVIRGETDVLELWVPTDRGIEVYEELHARQLPPRFEEYRDVVLEFEREKDAFVEYVERKGDAYLEDLDTTAYSQEESSR